VKESGTGTARDREMVALDEVIAQIIVGNGMMID
jgi:hypothetical protein